MLYINNTGDNEVIVTLYEKSGNITNPNYTWKLVNNQTQEQITFYQIDHSPSPYYYNAFTISVAASAGLTAGIINVERGQYQYFIYEVAAPYTINLSGSENLVENGILNVIGTYSTPITFTQSDYRTIPTFMGGL